MPWALQRRILIIGSVIAVLLIIAGAVAFLGSYEAPSCTDGKQNQREGGVDCSGPCPYLCTSSVTPARSDFARAVSGVPGRIDVIASVSNPNIGIAAKSAPFTLELYDSANALIARVTGTTDLPPSSSVPVFLPNVAQGAREVARTFLEFDTDAVRWFRYVDSRVLPRVVRTDYTVAPLPRVETVVANPGSTSMANVTVVVTVFDGDTAIAASSTLIPYIAPGGESPAIFTWNSPWPAAAAYLPRVTAVLPLSGS